MAEIQNVNNYTSTQRPVPDVHSVSFDSALDDARRAQAGAVRIIPNDPHLAAPQQVGAPEPTTKPEQNMTTMAIGEEGGTMSTQAVGEEGRGGW